MAALGVMTASLAKDMKVDVSQVIHEIEQQAEFVVYTLQKEGWTE